VSEERKGLSPQAYEKVPGGEYEPYVPKEESVAEFTVRAIIVGSILGILFAAANAAVGLRVGLTISASIPVAVMSVALFRAFHLAGARKSTVLETNMSQTIGSAGESLAAGVIFTIPAFFIWGLESRISVLEIFLFALIGGLVGVLFMIPLRRYLISREHGNLPYPEGTACAEVIVAGETGGSQAKTVFAGLGVGALYTALLRGLRLWASEADYRLPFFKNAQLSLDLTPALLGVGYILGYRISAIMVGGSIISWLGLIPLISIMGQGLTSPVFPSTDLISQMSPDDIWNYYIRYIGAGAVAFGGIVTLLKAIPTIAESFRLGAKEVLRSAAGQAEARARTQRDLPLIPVLLGALILAIVLGVLPQVPVGVVGGFLIIVFAFFFVTVSSRIVGLIGSSSNPISGMTIATLLGTSLIFVALGYSGTTGKIAALSVGAVVCMAAAIAGDTSQDLKTGFLVGATPFKQQIGEMIGVLTSASVIGWTIFLLHKTYVIGSPELSAPQATIMSFVVDGIMSGHLPWGLILVGVALGLVMEILGLPSLALAVGIYLPLATMATVFVGGVVRAVVERLTKPEFLKENRERGVLFASGLVGGEGIVTVVVALVLLWMKKRASEAGFGYEWMGSWAPLISLGVFAVLVYGLYRASMAKR